ncbi:RNA 2'-phosphotransferase [Cohnella luojiensis]|uniref:RNA 2'-phosphotransferase n=1 Tax=Cohnella luojiensis TaxID=652876 RepID=A0A4Y8LPJ7_9BACL|nr:hypothetical protein E2980_23350 [Cohnella luojiensis]
MRVKLHVVFLLILRELVIHLPIKKEELMLECRFVNVPPMYTIFDQGLKPMGRQFVHLSKEREIALMVGRRKDTTPVLLIINSEKACSAGISFYQGNHSVYLSDGIPPAYINLDNE